jgi:hypothetical protein
MPAITEEEWAAQIAASQAADAAELERRAADKAATREAAKHALAPRKRRTHCAPDGADHAAHPRRIGRRVAQLQRQGVSDAEIAKVLAVREIDVVTGDDTCHRTDVGTPVLQPDNKDGRERNRRHQEMRARKFRRRPLEQDDPAPGKARGLPKD